jgi:hypothetical protein
MDLAVPEYLPRVGSRRAAGVFPRRGSRAAYRNLGRSLWDAGIPEVSAIYEEAARGLCLDRPEQLLPEPANIPRGRLARQGFIGAAMLVHSLALHAFLRAQAERRGISLSFTAYTGESFGIIITAAVASCALSVGDGARIDQAFTPLMVQAAEGLTGADPFEREMASTCPARYGADRWWRSRSTSSACGRLPNKSGRCSTSWR